MASSPLPQSRSNSLSGQPNRTATADSSGSFSFKNLPAGTFKIKITATDLQPFESYEITLHTRENYQLPMISLPIAKPHIDVTVTATEEEIAEQQVQAQIQQRVFGVFPNFYTSFLWDAAPLKPKQKFHLAIRSATDPVTFLTTGFLGRHPTGARYLSGLRPGGRRLREALRCRLRRHLRRPHARCCRISSLFRQDPRYFYQGTGTIGSRVWHALSSAIICRGDNGNRQFNYSHILGNFAAGGISNLYRPEADRGVLLAVDNALLHTAANAAGNLAREFALKNITTKVPAYAKGKAATGPKT